MQRRGVAPRRSASAGEGPRSGASADATSHVSPARITAPAGLDLVEPLALAMGAAEVGTRAQAATRVLDLAREGSVSYAAAVLSGAVAALVALATRRVDVIVEPNHARRSEEDDDAAARTVSSRNAVVARTARDAAEALTALVLMDRGEGTRTLAASARTVAALLGAVAAERDNDVVVLGDASFADGSVRGASSFSRRASPSAGKNRSSNPGDVKSP